MRMRLSAEDIRKIEQGLGRKTDAPRWRAAILLGNYARTDPESVWQLAVKWGSVRNADTRTAIATCVLEHLFEYHFEPYFTRTVRAVKRGNRRLGDTLSRCWAFGQANTKRNGKRLQSFNKWFSNNAAG